MKRLLPVLMGFALLLLSSTEGWCLPPCPGSPLTGSVSDVRSWNNCSGTFIFPNGDKHVGDFKNGKPNGHGTATYASGNKYVGEYKNGKRNGQGTYTFANGDTYVGEWKDGKRHGHGTYTTTNTILEGIWENDKFKSTRDCDPCLWR